jgi:hypothetical protein
MGSRRPLKRTTRSTATRALALVGGGILALGCAPSGAAIQEAGMEIQLPQPLTTGSVSVEESLHRRRSIRTFRSDSVNLGVVSQLLWAERSIPSRSFWWRVPSKAFRPGSIGTARPVIDWNACAPVIAAGRSPAEPSVKPGWQMRP